MATVKISGLPAAASVAGANEFEINEAGTSKKVTGSQIAAYVGNSITSLGNGVITIDDPNNRVGINNVTPSVSLDLSATDAIRIPVGTTAQRPTGVQGYIRYNTTLSRFESYNGTAWGSIGGGATGGGGDEVFVENSLIVTTNYTITAGKSASSVGDLTINSGVTVTIPSGSRWVIL